MQLLFQLKPCQTDLHHRTIQNLPSGYWQDFDRHLWVKSRLIKLSRSWQNMLFLAFCSILRSSQVVRKSPQLMPSCTRYEMDSLVLHPTRFWLIWK